MLFFQILKNGKPLVTYRDRFAVGAGHFLLKLSVAALFDAQRPRFLIRIITKKLGKGAFPQSKGSAF